LASEIEINVLRELSFGSLEPGPGFDKAARSLFPHVGSYDANQSLIATLRALATQGLAEERRTEMGNSVAYRITDRGQEVLNDAERGAGNARLGRVDSPRSTSPAPKFPLLRRFLGIVSKYLSRRD
jgi:hypothetical protein